MMYYIYHVKGVKIGATNNVQRRITKQGFNLSEVEILETHDCIYKTSEREMELQKQYGYKVDIAPYWKSVKNRAVQAKINKESGHWEYVRKLGVETRKKPILQFDLDNNFIKEWPCANDCAVELKLNKQAINNALKGRSKYSGGFIFKYKEDNNVL